MQLHPVVACLATLGAALLVGWILLKCKVPGAMMVGGILGVLLLNLTTNAAYMPRAASFTARVIAGAYIGCMVKRDDIQHLPRLLKPMALMLGGMLITNLVIGFFIVKVSPLDPFTALMSGAPGGLSDMPLIAAEMGAQADKVAVLQFVRMLMALGMFPALINAIVNRRMKKQVQALPCAEAAQGAATSDGEVSSQPEPVAPTLPDAPLRHVKAPIDWSMLLLTLSVAAVGGLVGHWIDIPAGELICSLVATGALKLSTGKGTLPLPVKRLAQMLAGAFVGCTMDRSDILELRFLLLPALIILACYSLNCVILSRVFQRVCHFEPKVSMLAATPAGASDMALISSDIGVDSPDLVVMQVLRLLIVVTVFPHLLYWIAGLFP